MKTEESEVTIPNTGVSVAGPGAALETALETALEVVRGLDVSGATGIVLEAPGAVMVAGPGTETVGPGDGGSVLTSGTPGAVGVASAAGARTLVLAASVPGLLTAGWARAGSFFPGSGV